MLYSQLFLGKGSLESIWVNREDLCVWINCVISCGILLIFSVSFF